MMARKVIDLEPFKDAHLGELLWGSLEPITGSRARPLATLRQNVRSLSAQRRVCFAQQSPVG
jgi:hypothetical protein